MLSYSELSKLEIEHIHGDIDIKVGNYTGYRKFLEVSGFNINELDNIGYILSCTLVNKFGFDIIDNFDSDISNFEVIKMKGR